MFIILGVFLLIILLLIAYHKWQTATSNPRKILYGKTNLHGKTAIITGGTSGVGLEIAMDFARRGAKVIIACPNEKEGYIALVTIARSTGNHNIYFKMLNLASLKSVRNFAAKILEQESRLDILVNNAGVTIGGNQKTVDGVQLIMQVNYYAHFLLTILLLPLLMKTATKSEPCRIILKTSSLFKKASLDGFNFNDIKSWPRLNIYANSQLYLVMFSRELAKRLASCNVVVNCAVPGVTASWMFYNINEYIGLIVSTVIHTFITPWRRAATAIHVAVDEKAGHISGKVYENCKIIDAKENSHWDVAEKKLWEHSVKLVNLQESELNGL